jgi:hypothetical protein
MGGARPRPHRAPARARPAPPRLVAALLAAVLLAAGGLAPAAAHGAHGGHGGAARALAQAPGGATAAGDDGPHCPVGVNLTAAQRLAADRDFYVSGRGGGGGAGRAGGGGRAVAGPIGGRRAAPGPAGTAPQRPQRRAAAAVGARPARREASLSGRPRGAGPQRPAARAARPPATKPAAQRGARATPAAVPAFPPPPPARAGRERADGAPPSLPLPQATLVQRYGPSGALARAFIPGTELGRARRRAVADAAAAARGGGGSSGGGSGAPAAPAAAPESAQEQAQGEDLAAWAVDLLNESEGVGSSSSGGGSGGGDGSSGGSGARQRLQTWGARNRSAVGERGTAAVGHSGGAAGGRGAAQKPLLPLSTRPPPPAPPPPAPQSSTCTSMPSPWLMARATSQTPSWTRRCRCLWGRAAGRGPTGGAAPCSRGASQTPLLQPAAPALAATLPCDSLRRPAPAPRRPQTPPPPPRRLAAQVLNTAFAPWRFQFRLAGLNRVADNAYFPITYNEYTMKSTYRKVRGDAVHTLG